MRINEFSIDFIKIIYESSLYFECALLKWMHSESNINKPIIVFDDTVWNTWNSVYYNEKIIIENWFVRLCVNKKETQQRSFYRFNTLLSLLCINSYWREDWLRVQFVNVFDEMWNSVQKSDMQERNVLDFCRKFGLPLTEIEKMKSCVRSCKYACKSSQSMEMATIASNCL